MAHWQNRDHDDQARGLIAAIGRATCFQRSAHGGNQSSTEPAWQHEMESALNDHPEAFATLPWKFQADKMLSELDLEDHEEMEEYIAEINHGPWTAILVDSGAFTHVCPPSFAPHCPLQMPNEARHIVTASGKPLRHVGYKEVPVWLPNGETAVMHFEVCQGLRRPILSVGSLLEKGYDVSFARN